MSFACKVKLSYSLYMVFVKDKADVVKASVAKDKDKANVVKDKPTNVVKDKADFDKVVKDNMPDLLSDIV
nr:hypothetical protein [Tanacetum cinerariifolium]